MNTNFLVFDPNSGRITQYGNTDEAAAQYMKSQNPNMIIGYIADMETDYVFNGSVRPRPSLLGFEKTEIVANGQDAAIMTLPEPMEVVIDENVYQIENVLEIVSDMPATYKVEIKHFPYLDFEAEIVAK